MRAKVVLIIAVFGATLCAQTASKEKQEKKPTGLYQRTPGAPLYQQKDDFFHASTRLVNPHDIDYGAMIEQRRQAFLDASVANPFFWYSALTTALLMALMIAYGLRVMDEKRRLWRAAEILTDVWNDSELARTNAPDGNRETQPPHAGVQSGRGGAGERPNQPSCARSR